MSRIVGVLWLVLVAPGVRGQSNYASQGNSIEYQPGLPPSTVLDGKVTKLDDISPIIFLNRTKAYLNCGQGSMQVELKFEEPFYGVAYADFDRNSACMTKGRGLSNAKLEIPLKGCGTRQDPQRVFTNNIVVRFHPGLEMDGDEVITIVCRYPPPVAPAPPAPPASIMATAIPPLITEAPLKGFQILLIICAILFLSLLLLGLGCSYMCLKRRNVRVIHRHPFGSVTGSEITKLSGSSLGNISMFEGLKIPRAHALLHSGTATVAAAVATAASTSGSEANLVIDHSDTLPSDYPSESHSEVDEERSLPVSSAGSYDNKAFIQHQEQHQRQVEIRTTTSSLYSETLTAAEMEATSLTAANASRVAVPRHPMAVPLEPKFDVQMRVKRAPPPPPSPLPSESDVASVALERNLTTILEREESSSSFRSRVLQSPPPRFPGGATATATPTTFSYIPELHAAPLPPPLPPPGSSATIASPGISRQQTPPVYSRILRKQAERESSSILVGPDSVGGSPGPAGSPPDVLSTRLQRPGRSPAPAPAPPSSSSFNAELTEVTDMSHAKYRVASILAPTPPPPPPPPIIPSSGSSQTVLQHREYRTSRHLEEMAEPLLEPQVLAPRRPEITTHEVDDVFLRTVTEKKTIEDVERHRRQVTEYRAKPPVPPPDPKWDVTIRNYPVRDELCPAPPEWENFSDASSASNLTLVNEAPLQREPKRAYQEDEDEDDGELDSNIEPTYTSRGDIPSRSGRPISEESPGRARVLPSSHPHASTPANWLHRLSRVLEPQYAAELSEQERAKWREVITTESTLRTLLTEAVVREDYELIRKDARYTNLFPPAKWDVIIRILSPAPRAGSTSGSSSSGATPGGPGACRGPGGGATPGGGTATGAPGATGGGKSGGQQRYKRSKSSDWETRSRRSSLPTLYEYESDGGSSARTLGEQSQRLLRMSQSTMAAVATTRGRRRAATSATSATACSEADLRSMSEMTVRDFARVDRDDLTSLSSFEGADSLVRSLSQPSLARSGSEFTEHWGVPSGILDLPGWTGDQDGLSSAETTPRPIRRGDRLEVMATFEDLARGPRSPGHRAVGGSSFTARSTTTTRYTERTLSENQRTPPSTNWFHDDSEPEMQI